MTKKYNNILKLASDEPIIIHLSYEETRKYIIDYEGDVTISHICKCKEVKDGLYDNW